MPEQKKAPKKTKVLIKNLGSAGGREIGAADAKSIRGGSTYECPSKQCRTLVVKIVSTASAAKVHKVVIYAEG